MRSVKTLPLILKSLDDIRRQEMRIVFLLLHEEEFSRCVGDLVEIEFLHFFFENLNWSKSFLDFLDSSGRIIHAVLHDVSRYDMLGNRYGGLQIN